MNQDASSWPALSGASHALGKVGVDARTARHDGGERTMNANIAALLYLVAGVLFILALRGLSSPETSRQGNLFGMIGMAIAIADHARRASAGRRRSPGCW